MKKLLLVAIASTLLAQAPISGPVVSGGGSSGASPAGSTGACQIYATASTFGAGDCFYLANQTQAVPGKTFTGVDLFSLGSATHSGVFSVDMATADRGWGIKQLLVGPAALVGTATNYGSVFADDFDIIIQYVAGGDEGGMAFDDIGARWQFQVNNTLAATPTKQVGQWYVDAYHHDDDTAGTGDIGYVDTTINLDFFSAYKAGQAPPHGFTGTFEVNRLKIDGKAVASLATCGAGTLGLRDTVTDSNAVSFTAGIGSVVAAGGSTKAPVFCDGINWRIG